ncbi:cupin domain-containing protein [Falsiroseomonas sp. E2-1-a20]|uniref:cupin domain-containing protein n=1 Tax=Falsiroseomonas sp. E2-1-a20 TaxID=3239300 RepID=UPI003F31F2FC
MKTALRATAIGLAALFTFSGSAAAQQAQSQPRQHVIQTPEEMRWGPGPASLPKGAEAVTLHGNPSTDGLFTLRLRLPAGYMIPPHTHPRPEIVTVISGTFHLGTGETINREEAKPLPAGSFFAFSPGMAHFAFTREETVVQLNSTGPWALDYIDPADDPRGQTSQATGPGSTATPVSGGGATR